MSKKKVLQIYEGEVPLTLQSVGKLLLTIKDEELRETANSTYSSQRLPKNCDNKEHIYYRKCVGGGVCLARKYRRLFAQTDSICGACESEGLIATLNYIFDTYYGGKYKAAWRAVRTKTPRPEKAKRGRKKKEEQPPAVLPVAVMESHEQQKIVPSTEPVHRERQVKRRTRRAMMEAA